MNRTIANDRYTLVRILGGGGMGEVYLVRDENLGREVALKILRQQYARDVQFVERFEREARSAASLNHPNIVQIYDRGRSEDGSYYIVMEHVPGGTLKDLIVRQGNLDPDEAVRLASQVAEALGTAHAAGVVHRDIKPQNVLLTADGDVKVADFGVARAAEAGTISDSGVVVGTANYMSPEQAMGDPVGPAGDLYSLGVVIYEMLTGEVPFEADSAISVAMKHITEPPRPPRELNPLVPEALDAVVVKLLAKRPEDRHGSAQEAAADLRRAARFPVADGAETQRLAAPVAFPGGANGSLRKFSRRKPWWIPVLLAVLVTLLAVAGVVLSRGGFDGPVVGSLDGAAEEAKQALGVGRGEVPEVVGLDEEEARKRLADQGFGISIERRTSAAGDRGKVLQQSVPGGKEVERGSRIVLAVGDGPRTVKAPDLSGLTASEAERHLEEAGLKPGGRDRVPSHDVPEGEISGQDPPPDKEVKSGTKVNLIVSSGPPENERIEVPKVRGMSVDEALTVLRGAGFEVAGKKIEASPRPAGTILRTDPPAGAAKKSGTPVFLIVSGGPASHSGGGANPAPPIGNSAPSSATSSASATPAPSSGTSSSAPSSASASASPSASASASPSASASASAPPSAVDSASASSSASSQPGGLEENEGTEGD